VDDDALSRELLTLLLELEGYAVAVAASGEEAVARLSSPGPIEAQPGVVLADIQMPGLSGPDLARALRPLLPSSTPVLAMSGSAPRPGLLEGFDGFLLKPFKISELQSMIHREQTLVVGREDTVPESAIAHHIDSSPASIGHTPGELPHPTQNDGILDVEIYTKLRELMPTEQLGQMYALCMEDSRKRIVHMRALAAARDDVEFRREAHAVKGGCGMIGATELYLLSEAAERDGLAVQSPAVTPDQSPSHDAPATRTSGVTAMLDQLGLACDRLERILMEHMRE
jgi:CheY-like chemotaxis protein/HPt (histidine-containing phosphotransfer) domain-containing protein